jgi:hypothetical protein
MFPNEQLPGYGPAREEQILAGFRGAIRPVKLTSRYLLSLMAAAAATLLAALIYGGLIAVLVWLAVRHLFVASAWGRSASFIESALIVFLLQPLRRRSRGGYASLRLDRGQDPLLFDFVDRLCQATGMSRPDQVHMICEPTVTARIFGWLRRTRVLQLGLPLVESMSLQQIAGVAAHELGRFGLKAESRLWPAVQRISRWLEGGADLRHKAETLNAHGSAMMERWPLIGTVLALGALPLYLGLLGVAGLVEALRLLAAAASSTLGRQDEAYADRYLVEVAGSTGVAASLLEQAALDLIFLSVRDRLLQGWREGRLPENLPRLIGTLRQRDRLEIDRAVTESFLARQRRPFSGCRSITERIGNALEQKAEGIFHSDLPAIVLLRDPEALSRTVTFNFYQGMFGRQLRRQNLVSNDVFLSEEPAPSFAQPQVAGQQPLAASAPPGSAPQDHHSDDGAARERVFPAVLMLRPLPFSYRFAAAPGIGDREQLEAVRDALARDLPAYRQQIHHYAQVFDETIELRLSMIWRRGVTNAQLTPTRFGIYGGTWPDLERDLHLAQSRLSRAAASAAEFERLQVRRVALGLEIVSCRPEIHVATPPGGVGGLLAAAGILYRLAPSLVDVERQRRLLSLLDQEHVDLPGDRGLRESVDSAASELRAELRGLRFATATTAREAEPELGGLTLAQFCFSDLPEPTAAADLSAATSLALDRLMSSHLRTLAQIAVIVEQIERELGFTPIDWPPLPSAPPHSTAAAAHRLPLGK